MLHGATNVTLPHAVQLLQDGQVALCTRMVEQYPTPAELFNQRDSSGRGLLHWASVKGAERLVDLALSTGGQPVDAADDQQWTPLMLATSAGHLAVARRLLGLGADPNAVNATGQCPLHYAASKNRPELARVLLAAGASAAGQGVGSSSGVTPLHRSCAQGHTEVTRLLLDNGAPVAPCDPVGCTPLHFACEEGRLQDARLLIEAGADPRQPDREGRVPLDLVQSRADRRQLEGFVENVSR